MIARLVGTLVDRFENTGIIDVQGVGYEVFAPERSLAAWATDGATALVELALTWPPETSSGVTGSMPSKATMPPTAVATGSLNVQV